MSWVHLPLLSPRAVCEALKLDSALTDEVSILRRNLLRLTGNREFGESAVFKVLPGNSALPSNKHSYLRMQITLSR